MTLAKPKLLHKKTRSVKAIKEMNKGPDVEQGGSNVFPLDSTPKAKSIDKEVVCDQGDGDGEDPRSQRQNGKGKKDRKKAMYELVEREIGYPERCRYDDAKGKVLTLDEGNSNVAVDIFSEEVVERVLVTLFENDCDTTEDNIRRMLTTIKARAKRCVPKARSYTGIARNEKSGEILIDLRHDDGAMVSLKDGEVNVVYETDSDVIFTRMDGMEPFPMPSSDSEIELSGLKKFHKHINAPRIERLLFTAWSAYNLAFPVESKHSLMFLVILGGQGSGKSSLCSGVIRRFIDPCKEEVMSMPRCVDDLVAASTRAFMPIFDNVEDLPKDLHDYLCMMSTNATLPKRKKFTDGVPYLSSLHSPLVFNGIVNFVTKPDLNSRCLFLNMETMDPSKRLTDFELENFYVRYESQIFRSLLNLAARALAVMDDVTPTKPSRMLTFSKWLAACEQVMRIPRGYLEDAYEANQAQSYETALGEQPLANALYNFALLYCVDGPWVGTCGDLLPLLEELVSDRDIRAHFNEFPHNAASLGRRFTQHAASLDALGVKLERLPRSRNRQVKISLKADCPRLTELAQD